MATLTFNPTSVLSPGTLGVTATNVPPGINIYATMAANENPALPISGADNGAGHQANAQGVAAWTWNILPGMPAGTYTVRTVDDNGTQSGPFTFTIQAGVFSPQIVDGTFTAPTSVTNTGTFGAAVRVTNAGTIPGVGTAVLVLNIGTARTLAQADFSLIFPGASQDLTFGPIDATTLPTGTGTLSVFIHVGPADGTVTDSTSVPFTVGSSGTTGTKKTVFLDNAFQIRTTQTNTDANIEYPINFNPAEWVIRAVDVEVDMRQTYLPSIPGSTVKMELSALIVSHSPDGSGLLGSAFAEWGPLSSADTRHWSIVKNVSLIGPTPQSVGIRVNHTYKLPIVPLTEQIASVTDGISVVLESIVPNPTTDPTVQQGQTTNTNPPPSGGWNVFGSFFTGLGTGALLAGGAILAILLFGGRR